MTEHARWRAEVRGQVQAFGLLGLLLLGTASSVGPIGLARADEPADAPLPEIAPRELASRLRCAWAAYERGLLEVTFQITANTNWRFMMNQGKPEEQEPIFVQFPGRARFLGDGERWRVEYDSMMPTALSKQLSRYRWNSGCDGQQLYDWNVSRNVVTLGEAEGGAETWKPQRLFWHMGDSLAEALEKPTLAGDTLTVGQRTVEGIRCYVVERFYARWGQKTEEIVSPRQGYLIVGTTWSSKGKPYHMHTLHGVHEVSPGFWAPDQIVEESRNVGNDGKEQLDRRTRSHVVAFEPKKSLAADAFNFKLPLGVDVTDRRIGYSYHNDPWWPEAGKLLREQFDWPKSDLSPLKSLGSPAKFEAKAAPPIQAADWINSGPVDLARLKGKVVLLEFWGTWCPPCREKIPALRTLYETYHPAGLEMISIHTPTKDAEAVRRFVREYRMPYPIAIDAAGESGGITSQAYGVTGYPCAFLVDHKGVVHTVGEATVDGGRLVQTLIPLLEQTGAKNVRSISLDLPRLSDAMGKALSAALPNWIQAAPRKGVLHGRISDGQGKPIAGAKVTGTLKATLLIFASPGGYQLFHPGRRFETSSEKDGRFEVSDLTRGTYALKVEAPGLAWLERDVCIGPDFQVPDVEFNLDQNDSITGTVRDAEGRPIPGATIDPVKWHHILESGNDVFTQPSGASAVQSDDAGRYRLQPLRHGRFTLKVTAQGYKDEMKEAVPAGITEADLTLTRTPANR